MAIIDSINACAAENSDSSVIFSCLRSTIRSLLQSHSTAELLDAVATTTLSSVYGGCHPVGHVIGSETYKITGNIEKTFALCSNACNFSCIHGSIADVISKEYGEKYSGEDLAHASAAEIEEIGKKYCDSDQRLCHVIGHLLYIGFGNNFNEALSGCARLTNGDDFRMERCEGGVFMQYGGGLKSSLVLNETPAAEPDSSHGYLYPCDTVAKKFQRECFIQVIGLQNTSFLKNGITDPAQKVAILKDACEGLADSVARSGCFQGLGVKSGLNRLIDEQQQPTFCDQFVTALDRRSCVYGREYWLIHYVSYTDTADYCSELNDELRSFCFNVAFRSSDDGIKGNVDDGPTMCEKAKNAAMCKAEKLRYSSEKSTLPKSLVHQR